MVDKFAMNLEFLTDRFDMEGDGISLSPAEYGQLLGQLTDQRTVSADYYSSGGVVKEFEKKAARLLGKEDALILPTGTMANLLALNTLAGQGSRVLVQYDSHIYRDSGDSAQSLGGINLIPVKPDGLPDVEDVQMALSSFADEKVDVQVKVLHLESPVRRLRGAAFPLEQFDRLTGLAQKEGIQLHLDGARLFIWSVWCGRSVASLAAPFETVYVSLWKYFHAQFGAILAGPAETIARLRHWRRRGGGALAHIWPVALVADYFMEGFIERLTAAKEKSDQILAELSLLPGVSVDFPANSTNQSLLRCKSMNIETAKKMRKDLLALNIQLPPFSITDGGFWIKVNESWNNMEGEEVVSLFKTALNK